MKLQIANGTLLIRLVMGVTVALGAGVHSRAEVLDRVLAIVGGEMITLTDVTAARDFGIVDPAGGDPIRDVLPRLIDRELIIAEVDRYAPPEPTDAEVETEYQLRRGRFATAQDFDRALAGSGINEERLRETLRQNLRIRAYLDQRFAAAARERLVSDWVAGLRRRTEIVDLTITTPSR